MLERSEPLVGPRLLVMRLQQDRRERWRQRQRHKGGNQRRRGDGDGELLVECALQAGDVGDGDEDGGENQRDGDQRAGDFVHRLVRGLLGRQALSEITLDILDDDDGVVDHDADGQNETKERQRVEGQSNELHDREAADERDGDRHDRNNRRAPRLKEEDDDQNDEQDRFAERALHLLDGLLDELGGVIDDRIGEAGREKLPRLNHRPLHRGGGGERIGAGLLKDDDGGRGVAVEISVDRVILRADLDPRHIAQAHLTVGVRTQHDVGEFSRVGQAPDRAHRELKGSGRRCGRLIDRARGDLEIGGAQSDNHFAGRHAAGGDLVRVEPDPHGIVSRAEDAHIADALEAGEFVAHIQRRVV